MKVLRMMLENFMCYASAEFDFFDITRITAKNGKGKSSIATAYMWCLFGCDYELKDNPPVRREVNGKTVDDMDRRNAYPGCGRERSYHDESAEAYIQQGW